MFLFSNGRLRYMYLNRYFEDNLKFCLKLREKKFSNYLRGQTNNQLRIAQVLFSFMNSSFLIFVLVLATQT